MSFFSLLLPMLLRPFYIIYLHKRNVFISFFKIKEKNSILKANQYKQLEFIKIPLISLVVICNAFASSITSRYTNSLYVYDFPTILLPSFLNFKQKKIMQKSTSVFNVLEFLRFAYVHVMMALLFIFMVHVIYMK